VKSILIDQGAHHLDLMFSNDLDPDSVLEAREIEKNHIKKWLMEGRIQNIQQSKDEM